MTNFRPKPPKGLSLEAKRWWRALHEEYQLDDQGGLLLLAQAMESFDRLRQAQRILEKDGLLIADRFGQQRQHPATLVERDARGQLIRCLRSLNLDIEPPAKR